MWCGECLHITHNAGCFVAYYAVLLQNLLLLQFSLFCREICFVTFYEILHGETISLKMMSVEKTGKYQVWYWNCTQLNKKGQGFSKTNNKGWVCFGQLVWPKLLSHESQWSVDRPSEAYGAGRGVIFRKIKHDLTDIGPQQLKGEQNSRPSETHARKQYWRKVFCGGEIDLAKVP